MSHWFDRLCQGASKAQPETLARRNFLIGAFSGTAVALLDSPPVAHAQFGLQTGRQPGRPPIGPPILGDAPQPPRFLPTSTCKRTMTGSTVRQSVQVVSNGVTYRRAIAYDTVTKSLQDTLSIDRNGQTFLNVTATSLPGGSSTAAIDYGPLVTGARTVRVTSVDGKAFRGTVDGRAVLSTVNAKQIPTTEFLDHRPAPVLSAPAGMRSTVNALAKQVRGRLSTCVTVPANPILHGPTHLTNRKAGALDSSDPGIGWYQPGGTFDAPGCTDCWNNCGDFALQHSGLEDWETYLSPLAIAAAIASYDLILLGCWGVCQAPGGGCDPVPCGSPFVSCGKGDNCFRGDLCCPASMVVCNNVCCGPDIKDCGSDGTCACPNGAVSCGAMCCPPGQICCGDTCVPVGGCNNGCPAPLVSCNGQCCAPFATCCNGQCCGHACVNNSCCPQAQACGGACCARDQVCSNGSCFSCTPMQIRFGLHPCQSNGPNGVPIGVCCGASSPTCCGGVCCGTGQNFCIPSNGTLICSANSPIH